MHVSRENRRNMQREENHFSSFPSCLGKNGVFSCNHCSFTFPKSLKMYLCCLVFNVQDKFKCKLNKIFMESEWKNCNRSCKLECTASAGRCLSIQPESAGRRIAKCFGGPHSQPRPPSGSGSHTVMGGGGFALERLHSNMRDMQPPSPC